MISQNRLKEVLDYDPITGVFKWKIKICRKVVSGRVAGSKVCLRGAYYIQIRIDGKLYQAHRVAWLFMSGEYPSFEIDHRDLDGCNNSWLNLRPATSSQNKCNRRKQSNNSSGYKGVVFHSKWKKYTAEICVNHKRVYLGHFDTAEKAHAAYISAAQSLHGEFACLN